MARTNICNGLLRVGTSLAVVTLAMVPAMAAAQDGAAQAATTADEAPAADEGHASGGDIIVTALRRDERLIDVPVAVSAVGGDTLQALGVVQPTQIANLVPGVQFQNVGSSMVFSIRGVTLNDYGDANESPVAFYRDDVYIAALGGTQSQMFDIDRVEVLRGPQGTLFGRNATGGLVSVFSRQPTQEFDAQFSLQYGSYDQVIVEAAIGGPLSDRLRTRTSGQFNRDDGWQRNVVTGTRFAKTKSWALRQILEYDVTDDLTANINVHGGRTRNRSPGYGFRGRLDPVTGEVCSVDRIIASECVNAIGFRDPDPDPRRIYSEFDSLKQNISTFGVNGTLKYSAGDIEVVSITAFERTKKYYEEDADASADEALLVLYNSNRRQFSQELRAAGESGPLNWVVGAYYFNEKLSDGLFSLPHYVALFGTYSLQNMYEQKTESGAVFGQLDYELTDTLTATAGARYSKEKKSLLISDDFVNPTYIDDVSVKLDRVTWKLGLNWKFVPDWLAYASVSSGFKSPAFNTSGAVEGGSVASKPETSTSYEIGFKGQAFDRTVQFSTAAFYNRYRNFQLIDIPVDSPLPVSVLLNADGANIYGLEGEFQARPATGLLITGSVTRLWTKIDAPNLGVGPVSIDGNRLVATSKWALKGLMSYDIDAGSAGTITPRIDASYRSRQEHSLGGSSAAASPGYTLVNAGIGWSPVGDRYNISVFVDNLFDKEYTHYAYEVSETNALQWGRPRTWGVRLSADW